MAEEIQIAGTQSTAKTRDPFGVALLTLVTLGIYFFVWYYKVNREMSDLGRARGTAELGDSPGTSLLAVTLGALIIVPAIVSLYNTFQRTQAAAALPPASGEPRFPARAATTGFANRLATAGTNHAVRTSLESRGVFANVGYPAKSSSPPKPERATFSPTFLAAQETK